MCSMAQSPFAPGRPPAVPIQVMHAGSFVKEIWMMALWAGIRPALKTTPRACAGSRVPHGVFCGGLWQWQNRPYSKTSTPPCNRMWSCWFRFPIPKYMCTIPMIPALIRLSCLTIRAGVWWAVQADPADCLNPCMCSLHKRLLGFLACTGLVGFTLIRR